MSNSQSSNSDTQSSQCKQESESPEPRPAPSPFIDAMQWLFHLGGVFLTGIWFVIFWFAVFFFLKGGCSESQSERKGHFTIEYGYTTDSEEDWHNK